MLIFSRKNYYLAKKNIAFYKEKNVILSDDRKRMKKTLYASKIFN